MSLPWLIAHWSGLLESTGIIGGLLFTGAGFFRDARVRRAETLIDITKQHRELWRYFDETPELAALFDKKRDADRVPLTTKEMRFVNFLLLHLRATFYARKASIYIQPERLSEDIRDFFSHPATRAAWKKLKESHDPKFVVFVELNFP